MRKILFRAVAKGDLKTMVYGYYHYDSQTDTHYICLADSLIRKEIDPDTLGQFTGLTDKNGKEIWENDIIKSRPKDSRWDFLTCKVVFNENTAKFEAQQYWKSQGKFLSLGNNHDYYEYEVIGNLHENPELL